VIFWLAYENCGLSQTKPNFSSASCGLAKLRLASRLKFSAYQSGRVEKLAESGCLFHLIFPLLYCSLYNTIQYNTKFVKRHVAVASEAL